MASLFNKQISATYKGLLKTTSNGELTSSLAQITDGSGNGSKLYLSTTTINFYNAYSFPSSDGSANQVLKTDGSGTLSWANDSVASTLNFSGSTSGTGSVALNTQTLAFTGTANQITATASSQAITFAFPSGGVTLPNGSVATTQSASDNSTKVATTAYVEAAVAAGGTGNVNVSGTPSANQIAIWTNATTIKGMSTLTIDTNGKITLTQSATNYNIGGGNLASVSGTFNTGFGEDNLNAITSGLRNTAFGYQTLKDLTIGTDNVAVGYTALTDATEAVECIAVGSNALSNVTTGHFNIGIGHTAGSQITTSTRNTLVGRSAGSALDTVSSGGYNTFIGYHSGLSVTSGAKNVILGSNTGSTIATSSNNIIISDGDGNNRLQFDSSGQATFSANHIQGSDTLRLLAPSTILFLDAQTDIAFRTSSTTERMRILSSGNVIVGLANSATNVGKFEVETASAITYTPTANMTGTNLRLATGGTAATDVTTGISMGIGGNAEAYIGAVQNSSGYADIVFQSYAGSYSEKMRILSNGKIGIGESAPDGMLDVVGDMGTSANAVVRLRGTNSTARTTRLQLEDYSGAIADALIDFVIPSAGSSTGSYLGMGVNGTSQLVCSVNGNVGVGTTSPSASLEVSASGEGTMILTDTAATANSKSWRIKSDNTVFSINAINDAGASKHNTLEISEGGNVAINNVPVSNIQLFIQGYDSSTTQVFRTDNASGVTLVHIRNNGEISTGGGASSPKNNTTSSSANAFIDSSGILLTSSSSKRFKNTITDATHGLSDVLKLRSVTYKSNNTKIDGDRLYGGFIAEEVDDLGLTEFVDYDDNDEPKSLHYANMVSLLTKAIQEQQTIIDDLKARIEKLEL